MAEDICKPGTDEVSDDSCCINIVIKTLNNDNYNLCLDQSAEIIEMKKKLLGQTGIPPERQRLIYRGQVLSDSHTLRDYSVGEGQVIHLVVRPNNYDEILRGMASNGASSTTDNDARTRGSRGQRTVGGGPFTSIDSLVGNARTQNMQSDGRSLEHLRQSLLTMNTVISALNIRTGGDSLSHSRPNMAHFAYPPPSESKEMNIDEQMQRQWFIGQWIDCKDTVAQWLEATIMDINHSDQTLFVHYNGWPTRWDEWIAMDSPRIAPFRTRTSHSYSSLHLSPTCNYHVQDTPRTGVDDVRTLLPEISAMFQIIQPLLSEATRLSIHSLQHDLQCNGNEGASSPLDPRVPWASICRSPTNIQNSGLSSGESENGGIERMGDDRKHVESVTTDSFDNSRLCQIAGDLCPLFDRFGRILSDVSPHLREISRSGRFVESSHSAISSNRVRGGTGIERSRDSTNSPTEILNSESFRDIISVAPLSPNDRSLGGNTHANVDIHIAILSPSLSPQRLNDPQRYNSPQLNSLANVLGHSGVPENLQSSYRPPNALVSESDNETEERISPVTNQSSIRTVEDDEAENSERIEEQEGSESEKPNAMNEVEDNEEHENSNSIITDEVNTITPFDDRATPELINSSRRVEAIEGFQGSSIGRQEGGPQQQEPQERSSHPHSTLFQRLRRRLFM